MDNKTPNLSEVIQAFIDAKLLDVHTALPAKIVSYNYATNLAVVKPLLKKKYKTDDLPTPLPTISNVPIAFPRMGSAWVRFPVNPGDTGKISFIERSIDKWLTTGGDIDPEDSRKFNLTDAIFEPGLNPISNAMIPTNGKTDSLLVNYGTSFFEIQKTGKFKMKSAAMELIALIKEFAILTKDAKNETGVGPLPKDPLTIALFEAFILKLEAFGDL